MGVIKKLSLIGLLCWSTAFLYAKDQLVFAVDVIRHGDRTPIQDVQSPPYTWAEGAGQLTDAGAKQEFQLGQKLRFLYVDQYHLLPFSYRAETLYVNASDYERTKMSARAFLSGLYPLPRSSPPIPIYSTPQGDQDTVYSPLSKPARQALFQQYVFSSAAWQAKNKSLRSQYKAWSKVSGFSIHNLVQVIPLGDALYVRELHQVPLPQGLSTTETASIIQTGQWAVTTLFKPQAVGSALSNDLLVSINSDFNAVMKQETPLKYVVFMGHDSTLFSLLSAMGRPALNPIPYASHMSFLLFETPAESYYVIMKWNGRPLNIPACHNSDRCSLAEFNGFLRP